MNADNLVYGESSPYRRLISLAMFCAWACVVSFLAWHHVVWRDEVRAYSFAQQGNNIIAMLKALHGEGHPALWYLLIRGGRVLIPQPQILQIVAILVAFAAIFLLVVRSPFGPLVIMLVMSSRIGLYEYSVMARNYGISMLLLFGLAAAYKRSFNRGIVLGVLLFLLANCNVHSVLMVAAFLAFWLLDIRWNSTTSPPDTLRNYRLNAPIAISGIALCAVTVLPAINDSGKVSGAPGITLAGTLIFLVSFISTLGLIHRPAALFAAWIALVEFALFFRFLYPGQYRHEALWLVFLISMYWIAGPGEQQDSTSTLNPARNFTRPLQTLGYFSFLGLLGLQTLVGILIVSPFLRQTAPESRSRDLSQLISQNPDLRNAIIIAEPDYMVESLPYYIPNPTYLLREHRFGDIVHFTHSATLNLTLDDILNQAQQLHTNTGKPIVILLANRLDTSAPAQVVPEAYNWQFVTTPEQVHRFQSSTKMIKRFGPVPFSDESYDVYVLN